MEFKLDHISLSNSELSHLCYKFLVTLKDFNNKTFKNELFVFVFSVSSTNGTNTIKTPL